MTAPPQAGPLLQEVLRAQQTDEKATSYPRLEGYCAALEASCEALGAPIVWPVGPAAERLAGAAVLASHGRIKVRGWSDRLDGERVLLLAVAAVTPIALIAAAEHARCLGARDVHACGIEVQGIGQAEFHEQIDGYAALDHDVCQVKSLALA